jgi:hypothetical protein
MRKLRSVVVAAGALIAMPLMGSPAWSAACVSEPVDVYTAPSFSCNVGVFEFSNINVSAPFGGVNFSTIAPFFPATGELGLSLNMLAAANGFVAAAVWSYTLSSPAVPAVDALLQTVGIGSDTTIATVMNLGQGTSLATSGGFGTATADFAPAVSLNVSNTAFVTGFSSITSVSNAFSPVPAPLAGAGLPGLIFAGAGLLAWLRRKRTAGASSLTA